MTELEILQRAKMYIDKLANGINPITNTPVAEQDVVSNVKVSRCLFYVSGVLDNIMNQETKKNSKKLLPFNMNSHEISKIHPLDTSVRITQLCDHINSSIDQNQMKKLPTTIITSWLVEQDILEISAEGRKKIPTQKGLNLGISTELRSGYNGEYTATLYSPMIQQLILDHLPSILERYSREIQGVTWNRDEDNYLTQYYHSGISINELSIKLKRTSDGIQRRLKKLGVIEN